MLKTKLNNYINKKHINSTKPWYFNKLTGEISKTPVLRSILEIIDTTLSFKNKVKYIFSWSLE